MSVTALQRYYEQDADLPGNDFSLIVSSNVLRYIRNLMIIAHNEVNFSVKAYVGFEGDNRMHWLEEVFYSSQDVMRIVDALLQEHVKKNPYSAEEILEIKEQLVEFDFLKDNAISIMFPEI